MQVNVLSASKTVTQTAAKQVTLPGAHGYMGILPGHAPMISQLNAGELLIEAESGKPQRYYISGGFVEVADGAVQILVDDILPADKLDYAEAERERSVIVEQMHKALTEELPKLQAELGRVEAKLSMRRATHLH